MKNKALILLITILFTGCASYTVQVISSPPGAKIEVNNGYVGDAPLDIKLTGGALNRRFTELTIIRATPSEKGQTQSKIFGYSEKIPEKIYFDTDLQRAPLRFEYDVDFYGH
jgi:hypothetical protein